MAEKYQAKILQLNKECSQLQFELKRLEKTKSMAPSALKGKFEIELSARREKMKLIEFEIDQLHILPLGSELKEKEVQALVEINVGDAWDERVEQPAIIIRDGIIKEIR